MSTISINRNERVAYITLWRPEAHNALNDELIDGLHSAFVTVGSDSSVYTVVLCGEGMSLCTGVDLKWMRDGATQPPRENLAGLMRLGRMLSALDVMPQTTIARAHGPISGVGVGLVAACDIAIGSPDATFCLSEVRLGLVPGMASPFVQRAIGLRTARRYFQTAELFSAAEAKRIGLLHDVVSASELDGRIDQLLQQLTFAAPFARAVAKLTTGDIAGRPIDGPLLSEIATVIADLRGRPEATEGLSAFLEKRKPSWTHRTVDQREWPKPSDND
jgi:methylglutaconyl-CoA hydratase